MKRFALAAIFLTLISTIAIAQNTQNIQPVFDDELAGLIYWEGEDAVSTNFAKEANLDYASSGLRILQLNQGPQAPGAPFFAEYAFYVDQEGSYNLWMSGTPPGPRDTLLPSYASPFDLYLDSGTAQAVYRENVAVVEAYSANNYWFTLKNPLRLSKGIHRLRVEVSQKRRYDNRYYLYLDAMFLLKTDMTSIQLDKAPVKFPRDMRTRNIDNPYLSINQYEDRIRSNPRQLETYLELASVYSMISDYSNALKILERAKVTLGDKPELTLLSAKNRIWSGEFDEGLKLYRSYLESPDSKLEVWAEAAKVMAWLGKYQDSLTLYQQALERFSGDLNLQVNQALTYLWMGRVQEGDKLLEAAWQTARQSEAGIKSLASIFAVNGYPKKTVETYLRAIENYPLSLSLLLSLEESLVRENDSQKAAEVRKKIVETFVPSDRLNSVLETTEVKNSMREQVLKAYQDRLKLEPDNLKLRGELVNAYFWNRKIDAAIDETVNILVNQLFHHVKTLDQDLLGNYQIMDQVYLLKQYFKSAKSQQQVLAAELKKQIDAASQKVDEAKLAEALAQLQAWNKSYETAQLFLATVQSQAEAQLKDIQQEAEILKQKLPWTWSRDFYFAELEKSSKQGGLLADYLLARLSLAEQNTARAELYLKRISGLDAAPSDFVQLTNQAALWMGKTQNLAELDAKSYKAYLPSLIELSESIAPQLQTAIYDENSLNLARQELLKSQELINTEGVKLALIQKSLDMLYQRIHSRSLIQFYQYELDSFELRYQLSDYYLNLEDYRTARVQLDQAIKIAPANINVKFNLARSRQLSGDWAGAMQLYKEIFNTDPSFENTASLYNQLAKTHSDKFAASFTSFWDNARVSSTATASITGGASSVLGIAASYSNETIRLTKRTELNDPVSINLHQIVFNLPLTFADIGLSITPSIGGIIKNKLYTQNVLPDESLVFEDIFDYIVVAPNLSAGLNWQTGPLTLSAKYGFEQVKDTLFPLRNTSYQHLGEGSASVYTAFAAPSAVQSFGSRSYAKVAGVFAPFSTETNTLLTLSQDLSLNFLLSDAPWSVMALSASASWEDSDIPGDSHYYAPDEVFTIKGGLQVSTWPGLGDGWVLGLSLKAAAGLYSSPSQDLLSLDGFLHLELNKQDLSLYCDLNASLTTDGTVSDYFSLYATIGARISLPSYLIP